MATAQRVYTAGEPHAPLPLHGLHPGLTTGHHYCCVKTHALQRAIVHTQHHSHGAVATCGASCHTTCGDAQAPLDRVLAITTRLQHDDRFWLLRALGLLRWW